MAIGDTNAKNKIINLANVEFTENGLYVPNKGVTGFGKVTVAVPPDAMKKPFYITPSATSDISVPSWEDYTGPYIDKYVKLLGYRKENRSVYDFNENFIGTATIDGEITSGSGILIGKVSNYRVIRNEEGKIIGYGDDKNYAYDLQDVTIGKVRADNVVIDSEDNIIGKVSSNEYLAYNNTENEYIGVRNIRVRKISSWIDSEISADNILRGHTILGVSGNAIELHGEERTVNSSTSTQVITPSNGKNGITKVTVNPYTLQNKTVDPEFVAKSYYADSGYNGLNRVTVNPIDVQTIVEEEPQLKPENVKKNVRLFGGQIVGTYDNYVAPVVQPISISPKTTSQLISPPSGVDGFNRVAVDAVTSSIDSNIKPENIRRNVNILGVEGTFVVEKLQDKTVDPQPYQQVVTFDSSEADGLNSVTVNAVTSSVDSNITSGNIKKNVTILGVTGDFDPQPIIQPTVTVTPTTLNQSVTPDTGYDGLGRVDINAVTSAIDPNILAENIKKNIDILGVTGTYDPQPNYQAVKTVQPITSGDVEVTADPTYDALLKVIVKAVTASIDPNILPKNIRKNISILGVLGSMEEGGEQRWFDFSGIQNFVELNQDAWSEGGNESIRISTSNTNYELEQLINDTFPAISNINAIMFTQVYGYDDEEITDDIIKECYINFVGGNLYQEYSRITYIDDQIRYFYPFINNYNVDGLTIGLDYDDGSERTMKLYVLINSAKKYAPVPVLVDGDMNSGLLPPDYDGFRYVKDIVIPAHDVYIPKLVEKKDVQWVLRDIDTVRTKIIPTDLQPDVIQASAYDRNYGETDEEIDIITSYKLKEFDGLTLQGNSSIAIQSTPGTTGSMTIPGSVEKQSGYYYYFKFSPTQYSGNSTYYPFAWCNALFGLALYRHSTYNYYYPAWIYQWTSSTGGNYNYTNSYPMYVENVYYFRVYVNGTTTTISYSSNGTSWNQLASFSSSYINPTNSNAISIYSMSGPNSKLYADGCYITDSSGTIVYSPLQEIISKKTSHEIVPLIDDMLLVNRDTSRYDLDVRDNMTYRYSSINTSTKRLYFGANGYFNFSSGFNTSSANSWEIGMHFTDVDNASLNRNLYSTRVNNSNYINSLLLNTSNRLVWTCYRADSYSNTFINTTLNYTLTANADYYVKCGYDNGFYYCYLSQDKNFNSILSSYTTSSSYKMWGNGTITYGNHVDVGNNSIQYVYLDKYSYIKINGEYLWNPREQRLDGNIVNYIDDGSPVTLDVYLTGSNYHKTFHNGTIVGDVNIDATGIASNFKNGNYLQVNDIKTNFDPFEIKICLITGSDVTTNQNYYSTTDNSINRISLGINQSHFRFFAGTSGSSWDIANAVTATDYTVLTDTKYYIKFIFDGTKYSLNYSLDDVTYIEGCYVNSSLIIGDYTPNIGCRFIGTTPFLGSIDLTNTYIKVNNNIWWQPNIVDTYDYDWIFTNDDNWSISGITNLGKKGILVVPEHNVYEWDQTDCEWKGLKQFTFNVTDEDEFYTNIIEG